ncbi:MAG: XTP/dITP diphosphatase [Ignavibacteria bacterium]|nr:XTP/dITP diphosphatase [Ignavibacteria bacterium]
MRQLIIASKNTGKLKEIKTLLDGLDIEVLSLLDYENIPDIPETGNTFEENAFIKAKAVFDITGIPTIADDSGLIVDHIGGAPGVYSARFAGEDANDRKNCDKLLDMMRSARPEERTARFKCVILLYNGLDKWLFDGICEGTIINELRGTGGFGYDPLFQPIGYNKTFAELGPEVKNGISHRGKAMVKLKEFLAEELQ